jgi:carbon storage regulator
MLILTRKLEEGIYIGDDIKIKVVSIDGGQVKLGITAPDSVIILREELVRAVKEQNVQASKVFDSQLLNKIHDILPPKKS